MLWEKTLDAIIKDEGWFSMAGHGGVFSHERTKTIMIVYVDDMLLLSVPADTSRIWRSFEKRIAYKDPESDIGRYLGAQYKLDDVDPRKPNACRKLLTNMDAYAYNAVSKFQAENTGKLSKVA